MYADPHTHPALPRLPRTRPFLPLALRVLWAQHSPCTLFLALITPVRAMGEPPAGRRGHSRLTPPPLAQSVPIISHSRWLLKQGELQQMSGPKTSRTLRTKKLFQEIYLFLFNDLLVICRQIPG